MTVKLSLILHIITTRFKNGHHLASARPKGRMVPVSPALLNKITQWVHSINPLQEIHLCQIEAEGIAQFMIAEGLIDGGYFAAAGCPEIAEMNQHFFDHLLECFSIGTEDLAKIEQELYHIHYIFISFHPSEQWHYTEAAIDYLIEDYPEFDAFCKAYITLNLHLDMACPSSQYLFHHYLTLLVSVVTLEEIVAPIKICLDFSYGEKYNRIIAQHMKHAIDTPVHLQRSVCVDTEIILSDILNKDTSCPVVMHWSTSPKQSDWSSLKAQIRQIRRDRTNQASEAFAAHKEIS